MSTTTKKKSHPARFSKEILAVFETILPPGMHLHDPFGGTGVRLGKLADKLECTFSGTEIQPSYIVDTRVVEGNAKDFTTYPYGLYWIVTSPVYPGGMAEEWEIKDASSRQTYRAANTANLGYDEPLHPDNMGRMGYRGTKRLEDGGRSQKRKDYWDVARASVRNWIGAKRIVVNVADFPYTKDGVVYIEPVVQDWIDLMVESGFRLLHDIEVETPGYRNGSDKSRDQRVGHEHVLIFAACVDI